MKKILCLVVLSCISCAQATEGGDPLINADTFLVQSIDTPDNPVIQDKEEPDIFQEQAKGRKLGLYLIPSFTGWVPSGVTIRNFINVKTFFEVTFCHREYKTLRTHYLDTGYISIDGSIDDNILSGSYGLMKKYKYLSPYFSFGTGFYFPKVRISGNSSINTFPVVTSNVGCGFGLGFFDLGIGYVLNDWTGKFAGLQAYTGKSYEYNLLLDLRLGLQLLY